MFWERNPLGHGWYMMVSWLASQESLFEGIFSMNICYVMSIYTFWMVGWWSDVINLLTSWYMNSDWGDWLVILFLTGAYRRNKHKTWIHFGSNNLHTHGLLLLRIISPACNKRLQGIHLRCFFFSARPNSDVKLCNIVVQHVGLPYTRSQKSIEILHPSPCCTGIRLDGTPCATLRSSMNFLDPWKWSRVS